MNKRQRKKALRCVNAPRMRTVSFVVDDEMAHASVNGYVLALYVPSDDELTARARELSKQIDRDILDAVLLKLKPEGCDV